MRKSAAQIFFQMQKSQIRAKHISAKCKTFSVQIYFCVTIIFYVHITFLQVT